jgi:3-oxoadipyl-CoA thiolase
MRKKLADIDEKIRNELDMGVVSMKEAVIIAAKRTPIGRYGGSLSSIRPDDLAATTMRKVIKETGLDPELIDDVLLGCANQAGEDNRNIARMALLLAGLPKRIPGVTVNRLCGSGMEAILQAARAIKAEEGDIFIAGGVESMSRAPWVIGKPETAFSRGTKEMYDSTLGWRFPNPEMEKMYSLSSLGDTAENVANRYHVTREEQDSFALWSQKKWKEAEEKGIWKDEIIPVELNDKRGNITIIDTDEHPRSEATYEKLAALKPAFQKEGTVTAGNSSGLNDGAAILIVMSSVKAKELGFRPLAKIVSGAAEGVDPNYMGIGPIPASRKALSRAGWETGDIEIAEINEAFASQAIASIRELNLEESIVNVNGGAIAIGHPLGCSGARIVTTLIHEMKRRKAQKGLATMCIGMGQGIAACIEAVQ